MKFCFGKPGFDDNIAIDAKDLSHAIKIFKISELFPEKYVDPRFYTNSEDHYTREYDYRLSRYIYTYNSPNPEIDIYAKKDADNDWEKVGSITLKECIEVNFNELSPQRNLLAAPEVIDEGISEETHEILPVVISANAISMVSSKEELRQKHDEIAIRKAELEKMVSEMNSAMNVIREELRQKQKIVFIIETYLGMHEEVVQIADGDPAPEGTPLHLFQQKLYMDEEVGIWDDQDGQGIDCRDIEQFDEWVVKNYKNFAHKPLSIVAWQVRRNEKEYGDVWANVQFNQWNKATYFLIRNGSRLYRIWSNIRISDLLFPTKDEYMKLIADEKGWGVERAKEKLQVKHENYLYGLIAIQGIIERTDILGTSLRNNKVNLLTIRGNFDQYVQFVRDAETEYWIGDGRPRWTEFLHANQASVKLGTRICLATEKFYFKLSGKDSDSWRCYPYRPGKTPNKEYYYTVEAYKGESKDTYFAQGTSILIRYKPGDTIWDPVTYEESERKRRVPWLLYSDEVLNFDKITIEDADYYMKNRLDRKCYIRMLPTLHWVRNIKLKEKALEDEFIKMIAGQLGWELNHENELKIQETISWWKLKNKWKRAITVNEVLATSMILKKLRGE